MIARVFLAGGSLAVRSAVKHAAATPGGRPGRRGAPRAAVTVHGPLLRCGGGTPGGGLGDWLRRDWACVGLAPGALGGFTVRPSFWGKPRRASGRWHGPRSLLGASRAHPVPVGACEVPIRGIDGAYQVARGPGALG